MSKYVIGYLEKNKFPMFIVNKIKIKKAGDRSEAMEEVKRLKNNSKIERAEILSDSEFKKRYKSHPEYYSL